MPRLFHAWEKNDFCREHFIRMFHVSSLFTVEETSWSCMSGAFFPPWPQTPVAPPHMTRKKYLLSPENSVFSPLFTASCQKYNHCDIANSGFLQRCVSAQTFWCVELTWKIWSECYDWINNLNDMNLQPPPDLWEEMILVVRSSRLLILLLHFFKQTT